MARPLRIEAAGMWYHVMNRGNIRKNIFLCDNDYLKFLDELIESCESFNVEIHFKHFIKKTLLSIIFYTEPFYYYN